MAQQSSAARVAGKAYRTFKHNGTTYLLSQPLRWGSYADEMALVLSLRNDPGEFALTMVQRLPASYHAGIWEGAAAANMRGIPSEEEWSAYNASSWKTAFMLWTCLDPKHKMVPDSQEQRDLLDGVQWCLEILTSLPRGELQALLMKIAYVSQDESIKNSSGPTDQPATGENQQTDTPATTDQSQSTNTSPSDTEE